MHTILAIPTSHVSAGPIWAVVVIALVIAGIAWVVSRRPKDPPSGGTGVGGRNSTGHYGNE